MLYEAHDDIYIHLFSDFYFGTNLRRIPNERRRGCFLLLLADPIQIDQWI